jgi:hypothetical protein
MTLLRTNSLFVKKSKCSFGATSIVYLGHVISESGVSMNSDKVEAITAWPTPKSAHGLRGFTALKEALSTAPVLHLPEFTKSFIMDCDASGSGFGVVLHQDNGPIAFFSRPFATWHLKLVAYERELIGLVQAVRHWRPYLWGRRFLVRTDHFILKFMLDQRLSIVPQHH